MYIQMATCAEARKCIEDVVNSVASPCAAFSMHIAGAGVVMQSLAAPSVAVTWPNSTGPVVSEGNTRQSEQLDAKVRGLVGSDEIASGDGQINLLLTSESISKPRPT